MEPESEHHHHSCWDKFVFDDRIVLYKYYKRVLILIMLYSTFFHALLAVDRTRPNDEDFNGLVVVSNYLEMLFFFEMCLNFFKNQSGLYDHQKLHKNCGRVSVNYLKTAFIWDFLPLLPLQHLTLDRNENRLFYLIKLLRLKQCIEFYNKKNTLSLYKSHKLKKV